MFDSDKMDRIRKVMEMAEQCFGEHGDCIDTGNHPEFTEGLAYFRLVGELLE